MLAKGIGKLRAVKYVNHVITLSTLTDLTLADMTKPQVEQLVRRINASSYKDNTKRDHKVILKKYIQWARGFDEEEGEYPEEVRWIKTGQKHRRLLPEDLWTPEHVMALAGKAETPRDRAFVLTLYESGCRIGETLSLTIRCVSFDKHGAVLLVNGKTGPRRVRVIAASPALSSWMNLHPRSGDPDAPLWVGIGTVGRYEALSYDAARRLLKRLAGRAGLNKRLYAHLLRHSRATSLATELKESVLKELMGWTPRSNMPETYVHLSGRDVDDALLKLQGIEVDEERGHVAQLTVATCPRCHMKVGPESRFCPSCGLAMNVSTAMRLEDERARYDGLMDKLIGDAEVRALLGRKIGELFGSQPPPPSA